MDSVNKRAGASPGARRWFPIQNVGLIPWALAERAYVDYARRHGTEQSLERLAERGGFGLAELGLHLSAPRGRLDGTTTELNLRCECATEEIIKALAWASPGASPQDLDARRLSEAEASVRLDGGTRRACNEPTCAADPVGADGWCDGHRPLSASRWRPIETAPKDGQTILVGTGVWVAASSSFRDGRWWTWYPALVGTRPSSRAYVAEAPTHWMPLPDPPGASHGASPAPLPCESDCNPYVAQCGAKFCTEEAREVHNEECSERRRDEEVGAQGQEG